MAQKPDSEELSAFVASVLRAIAEGVTEAQAEFIGSAHGTGVHGFNAPKEVEFDIAVSAKSIGSADGGLKIAVFGIGANVGGSTVSENSTISRIRFSVPTNFKRNG
jgi:hypothetical protein